MGFMDVFKLVGAGLKKPLSISEGFQSGLLKSIDPSFDPERRLPYGNAISGLIEGAKGNLSASQTSDYLKGDYDTSDDSWLKRVAGIGLNVGSDPLTWAGMGAPVIRGAAGGTALGAKLAGAAEGAGALTNVEKSAPFVNKAAQFARRVNTGENILPGGGLLYAAGARKFEPMLARSNALQKLIAARPATAATGAVTAADDVVKAAKEPGLVSRVVTKAVSPVDRVVSKATKGVGVRAPKTPEPVEAVLEAAPTPAETGLSVTDLVRRDLEELASKATPPSAEEAGVAKLRALIAPESAPPSISDVVTGKVKPTVADIEAADKAVIVRKTPKPKPRTAKTAPPQKNPNIERGLGAPIPRGASVEDFMGDVGPKAPVEDVPPFLRRTATPQQQAIENIVSDRSIAEELAGQNKFLQNVVGPFAPPVGSAITPEEIAYFLQNYG